MHCTKTIGWCLFGWLIGTAWSCTVGQGVASDHCDFYMNNGDWLPPNYVFATDCVCRDENLVSPEVSCVRKTLQELHASNFTDAFKAKARQKLDDFIHTRISSGVYRAWTDMNFASHVENIHNQVFKDCCCSGTPASGYFWHALFDWEILPPCWTIRSGQHILSACT